jgi:hypothetical protein
LRVGPRIIARRYTYARAADEFLAWCAAVGATRLSLDEVERIVI